MGGRGGRPGGGGTRLANCCIRSPPPSAPRRSWGANVLGEPEGPEQAWRQRRRRRERDQASRSSAGPEPKGRTASTPAGLGRQPTPLAAQRLRRRRPGAPLSSSVKFLKAARDSEEARKVQGRTDGCLCLPPRPPPPHRSPLLLLPAPAPLRCPSTTPPPRPRRPSRPGRVCREVTPFGCERAS